MGFSVRYFSQLVWSYSLLRSSHQDVYCIEWSHRYSCSRFRLTLGNKTRKLMDCLATRYWWVRNWLDIECSNIERSKSSFMVEGFEDKGLGIEDWMGRGIRFENENSSSMGSELFIWEAYATMGSECFIWEAYDLMGRGWFSLFVVAQISFYHFVFCNGKELGKKLTKFIFWSL